MRKAYKYRLSPTKKQAETLQWTLDCCRALYNTALQERSDAYRMARVSRSYEDQANQLPEIKEVRPEYLEIHSQVLQDVLRRVKKTFDAFFLRCKRAETPGYPRYQGQGRYDSFTYPQGGYSLTHDSRISLSKIGSIKVKLHREIQGKVKTCTIKREGAHWYVVFSCELEEAEERHTPYTDEAVGIDLGLYHFAALSTGDTIENPRHYRESEHKLAQLNQVRARKKRGSRRCKQAVRDLQNAHRKVRNQRNDFLHQWSRRLVNTYETIVFEDLAPSKMSKKPKAKQDEETGLYLPNGSSAKAGLNKSLLDAGWSTFVAMCTYKAECAGTVQVVKVDPYKTSQICSACGHEGPHKDLSERWHICENCGIVLDRDVNAALNILAVWQHGLNLHRPKKLNGVGRTLRETAAGGNVPSGSTRSPWL